MKSRVTVIVLSVLVAGCKISKPTALVPPSNIPQTFGFPADTVTKACIHWEKFYSDSLLISLIDTALVNNHDLQIALQRIEIARSDVRFARGQQFPVLSADVSAGKRKYGDYTADGVGNYDTRLSPNISSQQMIPDPIPDYFVGGFTTWELDVWGKLRNRRKAAVARFWASEKGAHMVKTNLVADVASTYYKLLSLDSKLHILEENIALQEKELRIVSIQKAAGHVTDLAIKQFESQLLNEKSDRIEVQQQIVETENKLNFLLGRYPQQIMRNEHILEKAMPAIVDVGVPSNLLVYRPDIQQAELDLVAANASVKAARAAFFPSITLSASVGLNAFDPGLVFNTPGSLAYNLIGGVTNPLLNRSAIKAGYLNTKAQQKQAYMMYQKTILNGFHEVHGLLHNINNLNALYQLKQEEIDVLTSAINSWAGLFMSGRASYLEVIISQRRIRQTKLELIDTRLKQYNSVVFLYKALGGGWQ